MWTHRTSHTKTTVKSAIQINQFLPLYHFYTTTYKSWKCQQTWMINQLDGENWIHEVLIYIDILSSKANRISMKSTTECRLLSANTISTRCTAEHRMSTEEAYIGLSSNGCGTEGGLNHSFRSGRNSKPPETKSRTTLDSSIWVNGDQSTYKPTSVPKSENLVTKSVEN